jgi:hypothetical protein
MIRFTIVNGKLVLDPNIVLFKELQDLYKVPDGQKYLQVIYYTHSTESDNPFKDLDVRVLEENILRAVFNKSTWKELKVPKDTEEKFKIATDFFIKYNSTPEIRMLKSIDRKIDEIATMLDDNIPTIEESVTNSGETKFNSNLPIMLNAFAKLETIMKSKGLLQNAIAKIEGAGRNKGNTSTSFRERGTL